MLIPCLLKSLINIQFPLQFPSCNFFSPIPFNMPHKKPLIINKPSLHLESTLAPSKKPPTHSHPSSMPHKNPPTIDKLPSSSKSTMAPAQKPPTHSHPSLTRTQPTKSPATPSYMIVNSLLLFHIFLDPNMFQTYTPGCKTHTTPYGNTLVIKGTGTVIVHLATKGSLFNVSLDECWHVLASSNNFYSCLHLISKGSQVMIASQSPCLLIAHKQCLFKLKLPKYFLLS